MQICITDQKGKASIKKELFFNGKYKVVSRSGLNVTEIQIIKILKDLAAPQRILFLENRTGVCGVIASNLYPKAEIIVNCMDLYYANKIRRNLSENKVSSVTVYNNPYIEQKDFFDTIFLQLSKGATSKELALDLIQQIHEALQVGGKCFFSVEGNDTWVQTQLKQQFACCSVYSQDKTNYCIAAKKEGKLKRIRNFQSEITMTIFKKKSAQILTIPAIFSHRKIDSGALALTEVAITEAEESDALLDMGCGCGAIGISIGINQNLSRVCFVDSNSRAVYITEKNCQINGLQNYEIILSDSGIEEKCGFTIFTGNPPYFSNYKIAELFINTAYKALKAGGKAFIVAKTATWHYEFMKAMFGNAEIINRRGYGIVKSVK